MDTVSAVLIFSSRLNDPQWCCSEPSSTQTKVPITELNYNSKRTPSSSLRYEVLALGTTIHNVLIPARNRSAHAYGAGCAEALPRSILFGLFQLALNKCQAAMAAECVALRRHLFLVMRNPPTLRYITSSGTPYFHEMYRFVGINYHLHGAKKM